MEVFITRDYVLEQIAKKGMSKAEFASRMGIVRQNLDSLLDSKKKDINTIIKMSEVLDIPFLDFIGLQPKETDIHGCIFINGKENIVHSREDIENLLKEL